MAFIYDLSAVEILARLGYTQPVGRARLEEFQQKYKVKLPAVLVDFLSVAADSPLFSTADVWTDGAPLFFYEAVAERIQEDKDYWAENPDEEDKYFQLSQTPRDQWPEYLDDYLEIGSDFGAGVVIYGIPVAELNQEDPPVYMLHEENEITQWEQLYSNLSHWLMATLCDVLSCINYDTAREVLGKMGWRCQKYSDSNQVRAMLPEIGLDFAQATANSVYSTYGADAQVCCCALEDAFYVLRIDEGSIELCVLSK